MSPDEARSAAERRRSIREQRNESGKLRVVSPISQSRSEEVRVLDRSKSGMKLSVNTFLAPGTQIQIHLKDIVALGEVRYCVPCEDRFHIGIRQQGGVFSIPQARPRSHREVSDQG